MKKTFDTVKTMREIRSRLSNRYAGRAGEEQEDLNKIHGKYGFKKRLAPAGAVAEKNANYDR
jgi:hypothetical protein